MTMKRLMTLLLMMVAVIATQAQSLTGKNWYADMSDKENSTGLILVYDVQGQCMAVMVTEYKEEIGDGATLVFTLRTAVPGTYTQQGKKVSMMFDRDRAESELEYDIQGVDEATKKIIMPQLKFEIEKTKPQLEAELIDTLPTNANYEITKLTDTELQFDGGLDFVAVAAD